MKAIISILLLIATTWANAQSIEWGDVVSVTPRVETYLSQRQVCEPTGANASPVNYALGGLAGALVGNQVGGGNGKAAATVVGALLGANAADNRNQSACRWESIPVERQSGYTVTYLYNGRQYQSITATHPGNRIRLQVTVTPIVSNW